MRGGRPERRGDRCCGAERIEESARAFVRDEVEVEPGEVDAHHDLKLLLLAVRARREHARGRRTANRADERAFVPVQERGRGGGGEGVEEAVGVRDAGAVSPVLALVVRPTHGPFGTVRSIAATSQA
jgi:hypothetical protein